MKKQKMLKLTAFPSNPVIENAFSAPVTHSGEVSVVFKGKNVSIHGWDGSSWSTIYTWNSLDPQYQFNNTYQSYYLKSLTGSEETINVSFFSAESYQGSTPLLVGIDRGTKLYDIDEVPIYTADDHNKMLTVMSNGSLAWLLANESFVVPEEGGSSSTPTGAGTFLEEFTMFGGGTVTDGVLSTSAATPSYYKKSGMIAPSTTATTAVFSMWFNPEQSQMGLYSDQHYPLQVDFGLKMFSSSQLRISTPIGAGNGVTLSTPLTLNEWHHALVTVETDIAYTSTSSKSMTVKLFIDGQEVYTKTGNSSSKRIRAYAGISTGTKHYIGAENYNGSVSYKGNGQFDFMEWVDDVTLSDAQILAMYNSGTRGWSVADAAAYEEEQSGGGNVIAGTFLEELTSASNNLSNGALITNNVFVKPANASVTLVSLDTDGIVDFNVDGTRTEEEMTLSMWFNPDSTSWTGWKYIAGNAADSNNEFRLAISKDCSGNIEFKTILWDLWTGSPKGISSKPLVAGEWTHLAMTWSYNGSTYDLKLFVDGVKCGELLNQNRNLMKMASNRNFALGALAFGGSVTGSSLPCSIDSVQIKSGTALTDSQVAAIAGQADRQMSIETAAQG
jgi:hypothetical protein